MDFHKEREKMASKSMNHIISICSTQRTGPHFCALTPTCKGWGCRFLGTPIDEIPSTSDEKAKLFYPYVPLEMIASTRMSKIDGHSARIFRVHRFDGRFQLALQGIQ